MTKEIRASSRRLLRFRVFQHEDPFRRNLSPRIGDELGEGECNHSCSPANLPSSTHSSIYMEEWENECCLRTHFGTCK